MAECCELLDFVLSRLPANGLGLQVAPHYSFDGKKLSYHLVMLVRRPKRGERGRFGDGTPWGPVTYAKCEYCPFCGKKR